MNDKKSGLFALVIITFIVIFMANACENQKEPSVAMTEPATPGSTIKLKFPEAPKNFQAELSIENTLGASREIKAANQQQKENQFITPNKARSAGEPLLFEWKKPVCSTVNPCKVILNQIKNNDALNSELVYENESVTKNHFQYNPEKEQSLKPGSLYSFNVIQPFNVDISNVEEHLYFYTLSEEEQQALATEVNSLDSINSIEEKAKKLEIYHKHGLWYDSVHMLNEIISNKPGEPSYEDYKHKIYDSI
jgi:hypothetical protein